MVAGRVEGKLALVTGAARGQGRSHALRLAEEGARVILVDIAGPVETVEYPGATPGDLAETEAMINDKGGFARAYQADVRDSASLVRIVSEVRDDLGTLDIAVANAGIATYGPAEEIDDERWNTMLDVNLTGVWYTAKAAMASMVEGKRGGSIVLTSSINGLKAVANSVHYTAAKHGVVGLMRSLAIELAPHSVRVNSVHPTCVETPMIINDATFRLFRPDLESPTVEDCLEGFQGLQLLPIPWVQPVDISNAVLFLASDEARYITGVTLPVDAGCLTK